MHINGDQPLLNILDLHDLDPGSGHTAYCRVFLIDLCPRTKFCSNQKVIVDHRKYICTDGKTNIETGITRSTLGAATLNNGNLNKNKNDILRICYFHQVITINPLIPTVAIWVHL